MHLIEVQTVWKRIALIHAKNYYYDAYSNSTTDEEFGQYEVVINENQLDFNPIYEEIDQTLICTNNLHMILLRGKL